MSWLKRLADHRRQRRDTLQGKADRLHNREVQGTFVADIRWERSEELRVDRLGPGPDDIPEIRDPWRPNRTLGPLRRR